MEKVTREEIIEQLNDFISITFPHFSQKSVDLEDKLLDQGIVDSLGVLEIVAFVQTSFEIIVKDEDILAENFDSIAAIAAYVERSLTESEKSEQI